MERPAPSGLAGPELDPVIHAQARLRVVAALATLGPSDRIAFPRLQALLEMTPGNLSTHLRKLEDAGYVDVTKAHSGRRPVTWIALSRTGRRQFEDYTVALRQLLSPAQTSVRTGYVADST
ncbi:MAG: Transcriptional regulator, MarR family [uncultured Blastococcus sp.]|uniref:Transcriptional regulator, MarR family n=1 Tax=uncultured Blastococcus sp. TaxID=217144 RepID=A0A6J4I2K3_9ACTN|nr:MAG: Transcriptional regulator, MarR family [uncultured Blastococcus sp.]